RRDGLDPRAATLFNHTSDPNPASGERFRFEVARCKEAPISFQNGNGEVFVPPPPEIDIDRPAALPYGDDLALNDGKSTARRKYSGGVVGAFRRIVRIPPKSELAGPGHPLGRNQVRRTVLVGGIWRNEGVPGGHQRALDPLRYAVLREISPRQQPAVAVGIH